MIEYGHGGDVYSNRVDYDFSSNLNPFGMPPEVVNAIREHASRFDIYPDPACRDLVRSIAAYEGVEDAEVLCTAGASDLIIRTCLAVSPRVALVTAPCFSDYEKALSMIDVEVRRHPLLENEGFELTERIIEDITEEVDLLFLCTPNNPTGLVVDRSLLEQVLERASETRTVVLLDECFLDFTDEPSLVPLRDRYPHLIIMKAFTKMFSMAGLRLGYGICSDTVLLDRIAAHGQTWAVSTPAQVAGVAALAIPGYAQRSREYVGRSRGVLKRGFEQLGLRVIDGRANYLLFQCPYRPEGGKGREDESPLYDALLARGFLIRRCADYHGLDPTWYRVAVKTMGENEKLLAVLRQALGEVRS